MRIALAQVNPTVGDLAGNSQLIVGWMEKAREAGADIVCFPELAITGYPPEDLVLKPAFVRRLVELLGEHKICVPRVGAYHHPLAAVYRLDVMEAVDRLLSEDRLRPFFLFESVPTRVVTADELRDVDPAFQTLRNLNTPQEYEAALSEPEA